MLGDRPTFPPVGLKTMNSPPPQNAPATIRPARYGDLEEIGRAIENVWEVCVTPPHDARGRAFVETVRQWYPLWKLLGWFSNPYQYFFHACAAERDGRLLGNIQVAPFNESRTTWRVVQVAADPAAGVQTIGSLLLRHCLEDVREARNWVAEVEVNDTAGLAIVRQNGFHPLARGTHWTLSPERLEALAAGEPNLPEVRPASNADAPLLCQLDTAAQPPFVRQAFDRHLSDFKTSFLDAIATGVGQWFGRTETVSGYVFDPQRQVAIGRFQVRLCTDGSKPHGGRLVVHPGYTWLYPELLCQMARLTQEVEPQFLHLTSTDYQPEWESLLRESGATLACQTTIASRSVWHRLRGSKLVSLENLPIAEMLPGLQPARKPIPSRLESTSDDRLSSLATRDLPSGDARDVSLSSDLSTLDG